MADLDEDVTLLAAYARPNKSHLDLSVSMCNRAQVALAALNALRQAMSGGNG